MAVQAQALPPSPRPPPVAPKLRIELAPWDSACSEFEREIPMDSPAEHADCLRRVVESGGAQCFHVFNASRERVGMMITRVDVEAARELVIVAVYAKRDSDGSILPEIVERIDDLAAAESCVSIRFHTIRPALARVMSKRYGYRLAEVVMRKDLSDV